MKWVMQSLVAVVLLTPVWIMIPYFGRHWGVSSSVFAIWYFIGTALSLALFPGTAVSIVPSVKTVLVILCLGIFLGGIANGALFSAVVNAPNPGLPVAVANLTCLTTFLLTVLLSRLWPTHFPEVKADVRSVVGMVLMIAGAAIIAVR